jgi:predicted secreted Zn-dependent protease
MRLFSNQFQGRYSYAGTPVSTGFGQQTYLRPTIMTVAIASLLLFSLLRAAAVYQLNNSSLNLTPVAIHTITATAAGSATTPSSPTPAAPTAAAVVTVKAPKPAPAIPSAPNCVPDTGYAGATQLDLTSAAPGLTQIVDATHNYQVYGYTNTQIREQINQCAPRLSGNDDFTGYTTYRLSWQYNFTIDTNNNCVISNPKIGIHISEVLPSWSASQYATAGLSAKWSSFIGALDTHEHGHIALDQQHAAQILASLQSMPATDCGSVTAAANAIINSGVAALDQANAAYDSSTNHGATQGAILP